MNLQLSIRHKTKLQKTIHHHMSQHIKKTTTKSESAPRAGYTRTILTTDPSGAVMFLTGTTVQIGKRVRKYREEAK
jgi:hypothetical protein